MLNFFLQFQNVEIQSEDYPQVMYIIHFTTQDLLWKHFHSCSATTVEPGEQTPDVLGIILDHETGYRKAGRHVSAKRRPSTCHEMAAVGSSFWAWLRELITQRRRERNRKTKMQQDFTRTALWGDIKCVEKLLDAGCDVIEPCRDGMSFAAPG